MRFYDTLQRQIVDFKNIEPGRVGMYTCGPTVYRPVHIGNLRTYITADLLRRAIESEGNDVRQITNITDVGHMTDEVGDAGEDRMMIAADDEGLSPAEIADNYTELFHKNLAALNIQPSAVYPKATDHINEMIGIIEKLIEQGHAYVDRGNVYFDVETFPSYGRLSNNTLESLRAGHRLEGLDPAKKNHYDFTLWRFAGERRLMKWPSPWGDGYPGWHIECSAMSMKYLGERFDLHTGGSDNIFPHHEDEIAQSEGAVGHPVVGHWLHGHHLLAEGRRMAKSAKNFYTIEDLVERGCDPIAFRFLVMQTRYRSQTNFTWDALESAQTGLERLRKQFAEWFPNGRAERTEKADQLDSRFNEAVTNDLDFPSALAVMSEVASHSISASEKVALLTKWDRILALDIDRAVVEMSELPPGAAEKIVQREKARDAKDWATADRMRKELERDGVEVIDTANGTRWTVKRS